MTNQLQEIQEAVKSQQAKIRKIEKLQAEINELVVSINKLVEADREDTQLASIFKSAVKVRKQLKTAQADNFDTAMKLMTKFTNLPQE
ncbi:hypothetical protein U2088_15245 [Listeria monocytogenes]|nr:MULTISPECIES: hypothetical protein [Listeria]EAF3078617.1 hypothetical protein [Listeria monocytogenes serotype 1/2a]EAC5142764.1 hypothetical protein [Listeria monocytogenes]EAC6458717.1 hypothetical protein [Listeria monocytogenes]EAC7687446.1 hypothetical protein [Listeria monocytogenes]EAC7907685.1 hypothetical protein [Listeria monocytogenes]